MKAARNTRVRATRSKTGARTATGKAKEKRTRAATDSDVTRPELTSAEIAANLEAAIAESPASKKPGLKIQKEIDALQHSLGVSKQALGKVLSIPGATMTRRSKSGEYTTQEADRAARVARLLAMAVDLMDDDENAARQWFRSPRKVLGNRSPVELAATELGGRQVEQLITRLEHGVYS